MRSDGDAINTAIDQFNAVLRLMSLAPDIVEATMYGRQPSDLRGHMLREADEADEWVNFALAARDLAGGKLPTDVIAEAKVYIFEDGSPTQQNSKRKQF